MRYQYEGRMFEAETAEQLVAMLHRASNIQAQDDISWMIDSSKALSPLGMNIRWDTPELFVQDLEKHGLLEKVEV